MSPDLRRGFRLGPWKVEPLQGALTGADGQTRHLEPKVMDVLVCLAEHANELVTREELLEAVWSDRVAADERLTSAISELRHALQDGRDDPAYIQTVPKRGYKLTGQIRLLNGGKPGRRATSRTVIWTAAAALILALAVLVGRNEIGLPGGAELRPISSIAVLPFENLTGAPEQEFFADGMTETLITELSRIGALRVISRQSVMQFKESDEPLPSIARKLNVGAVVEGSAMHVENRVRISVKLFDASTDDPLWADNYDRELTTSNIFAIQSEITKAITVVLRTALLPDEQDRLGTVPTESMAALDAYFLGKQQMAKRTTKSLTEAKEYFQQAIDLDPKFALAYVGLADSYFLLKNYAGLSKFQTLAKARIAIDQALDLDNQLGEAFATQGLLRASMDEYQAAERAFRRAIELAPNYATTYLWYGLVLHWQNQHEEALAMYQQAAALDPLSSIINASVGGKLLSTGRIDEAFTQYQETIRKDPEFAPAYHGVAYYHRLFTGQIDEAVIWARYGISRDPDQVENLVEIGVDYLNLGDPDNAKYWLNRAITQSPDSWYANMGMQVLHAFQGDDAGGLAYGHKAIVIEPRITFSVRYVRDIELRAGRFRRARALYEQSYPELLNEVDPIVDGENVRAAVDLAAVLIKTNEKNHANLLLNRSLRYMQATPPDGRDFNAVVNARIFAMQGRTQDALSALRHAVDRNWRFYWWYYLKLDPSLQSVHEEPEFQAMVKEIEVDMAMQLARLREFESVGSEMSISDL